MKTRIVWTKIWQDDWFQSLSDNGQKLFLYLLTNSNINLTGFYQVSDFIIKSQTRIKDISKAKKELYPKARFYKDWVYIPNAEGYGGYFGDKNETAKKRELDLIPEEVKTTLYSIKEDRVSIPYRYSSDTSINHKSIIINNNNTNNNEISDNQKQIIDFWNKTYSKNYKPSLDLEGNISYWLKTFSLLEIKTAIANIKNLSSQEFWKNMRPTLFFRQRNKLGEADYIETALNAEKVKGNTSDELLKQIGL